MKVDLDKILPTNSWFRDWLQCWPTTESPASFLLFSSMSIMGAVLGRHVVFQEDWRQIRPMLNLLLLGPSGVGKSSGVSLARILLDYIPEERRPQFINGSATREKLHVDLVPNPHAIIFASELAAFFSKETYKEGLIPYITELFDYNNVEMRTKKENLQVIENPEVTLIGASTREWLQDMLPNSAVSGGFLARFLLLYESHRERVVAHPGRRILDPEYRWVLPFREKTFARFEKIMAQNMHPRLVDYENADAADALTFWYNGHRPASGLLAPFAGRAKEMIVRIAIILSVSCGEESITREHIISAIKLYQISERQLGEIVTPTTPMGKLLSMVMDVLPEQGMLDTDIFKALRHCYSNVEVSRGLQSLQAGREVRNEGHVWFRA